MCILQVKNYASFSLHISKYTSHFEKLIANMNATITFINHFFLIETLKAFKVNFWSIGIQVQFSPLPIILLSFKE